MLTALYVENYAIVSRLELDFTNKMTTFTGETGAGKSIIIDALMLALGERAHPSIVRSQADKCEVQATFTVSTSSQSALWLQEHDINANSGEIILRRVIYAEGKSKSYINNIPFSLQKIKELSETLVDIHGQHQHQTLLHHQSHRKQLDNYANNKELLQITEQLYYSHAKLTKELLDLTNQEISQDKINLLQYQINEINSLELQEGEIETLNEEHKLLHNAHEYLTNINTITELLTNNDGTNARRILENIIHSTKNLPTQNNNIKNLNELINNALIQCDEALNEINSFASQVQLDPERLQEIEARMGELHRIARKYQISPQQLPTKLQELQKEIVELKDNDEQKANIQNMIKNIEQQYSKISKELHISRVKHAPLLAAEITQIIQKLGMPKGLVKIAITPLEKITAYGTDHVEYKVCTNPGMPPDSLNKIISGGELSRISLAIQMITAQRGSTPTLIFDEVDVGIGGATASLVGQLLNQLSERLQVLCVTHQPQVAAHAHQHFLVEKYIQGQQTFTNIKELSAKEKVLEIARMLGGLKITEQTILNAKELLET